jgi:hypothetical protein
MKTAV